MNKADNLFKRAALSFLRAFGGSMLALSVGVLAAPDLNQMYLLGVSALVASLTAAIAALQVFVPQLSFGTLLGPYGRYADSFVRAFVGAVLVFLPGVLNAPNLGTAKGLATAGIVGAISAGLKALQELATKKTLTSPPTLGAEAKS